MARTVLRWASGTGSGLMEFDAVEMEAPAHTVELTSYPVELGASLTDHVRAKPVTLNMTVVVSNSPAREKGLTHMDGLAAGNFYAIQVRQPLLNVPPSAQMPTSVAGVQLSKTVTAIATVRTWAGAYEPSETGMRAPEIRRVQNIYAELRQAMYEAREFIVATDMLGDFDRMLLRSVQTRRDGQSGSTMRLELEFQQVLYAELSTRDVSRLLPVPKKPSEPRSQPPTDEGKKTPEEADPATKRSIATQLMYPSADFSGAPI
jgi:hypothetical protein